MVVGKNRRFPPASAGCSQVASSSSGGGLNPIQQLYPNEKSKQTNPRQVQIFIALSHIRPVFLHLVRYFQIITLVFVLEKQYVHLYGDYQFAPVQQVHTQRASFYVPRVYKEYRGILAGQPGEQLRWMIYSGIQSPRDSSYLFQFTEIAILMKKSPPIASSIGYLNIDILYSGFLASQRWRRRMTLQTTYKIQKSCWKVQGYRKKNLTQMTL